MRHFLISVLTVLALGWSMQALADKIISREGAGEIAERITIDMIHLYAEECGPVWLIVRTDGGEEIGLAKEPLETIARSRLRSAHLYAAMNEGIAVGILVVSVRVVGAAVAYRIWFEKDQLDKMSGISDWSPTGWGISSLGIHDGTAEYIFPSVSLALDMFVDDFLRVNEDACGKPGAPPGWSGRGDAP